MRRISLLALACLLGLAAALPASAQDIESKFATADLNKDGKIDRAEYQRRMVEVFYFADKNKDGVVTIEEIAAIETVDEPAFKKADKNGDGKLTLNEFVTYRVIQFDEADTNHDGVLTLEEVEAWDAARR
ncbi:MAG: EF-hand domain-containing protein [Rhodospirillales bacterium]|nr:EF-hand domain-containing protein [Rhodospirillales bacterium]